MSDHERRIACNFENKKWPEWYGNEAEYFASIGWVDGINALPAHTYLTANLTCAAAANGHARMVTAFAKLCKFNSDTIKRAAAGGFINVMKIAHVNLNIWSDKRLLIKACAIAAKYGQIPAMRLICKQWEFKHLRVAQGQAAKFGRIRAMKLLRKWGGTRYDKKVQNSVRGATFDHGAVNVAYDIKNAPAKAQKLIRRWMRKSNTTIH